MGGTGQRGRGNRGRERCKNDKGLHLTQLHIDVRCRLDAVHHVMLQCTRT
jgi:hypothetical protein